MSDRTGLFSVWNLSKNNWATSTNYSTAGECEALIATIKRGRIKDTYEVRAKKFGTIKGE